MWSQPLDSIDIQAARKSLAKPMKNARFALQVFSALITAVAVLLLFWANWPSAVITRTTTLHLIAPEGWEKPDAEKITTRTYLLTLTYPTTLKIGQTAQYKLDMEQLPATVTVNDVSYQLRVRCELILPGFVNHQAGMFTQNIQDQKPVRFIWEVHALDILSTSGTLRTFIDYVSPDNDVYSQLQSVTELTLTSIGLVGLSTVTVTSLAVGLILLAGLTGALGLSRPRKD